MSQHYHQFASDNYAGICPQAMEALVQANAQDCQSYGDDPWTLNVSNRIRDIFEHDCEVWFTFNGTAANSLAIASLARSYHSVIGHTLAHIEMDECGAPEFFSNGTKVLSAGGAHGKIDPAAAEELILKRQDIHYPRPRVVSLTQSTELGTVYSIDEVATLADLAHQHNCAVHMDGARFANAVASLGCSPAEITWKAGVDVLCFGGTKNGLPVGEAVVFFDRSTTAAQEFDLRCKQAGQLASKMRFLSAPWLGLLNDDNWLSNAENANRMAQRMATGLEQRGFSLAHPVQANAVFVSLGKELADRMHAKGWHFYAFIGDGHHRLMSSWATTEADVDAFLADIDSAR